MTQLVYPNLNAVGTIGWCLRYAGPDVFGTTYVPNPPFAWTAWLETKFRIDYLPDVCVPVWFSYFTPQGQQQGHVVVWVPGVGFYSSPWAVGTTHAVLKSIAEVEKYYHCKFVGISLDILNLKVAEDNVEPFNEGDRKYWNITTEGEDRLKYASAVGDNYKHASQSILESAEFRVDQFVNQGDVARINAVTGKTDGNTQVGKTWKKCFEYIEKNAQVTSSDFVPYSGDPLFQKKK